MLSRHQDTEVLVAAGQGCVCEQRHSFPGNQGMSCCLWENVLGTAMIPDGKSCLFVFLVVELLHPLSIPFPRHAWVNLYVKHSARSHRDDLTVVWNEEDKVQGPEQINVRRMTGTSRGLGCWFFLN